MRRLIFATRLRTLGWILILASVVKIWSLANNVTEERENINYDKNFGWALSKYLLYITSSTDNNGSSVRDEVFIQRDVVPMTKIAEDVANVTVSTDCAKDKETNSVAIDVSSTLVRVKRDDDIKVDWNKVFGFASPDGMINALTIVLVNQMFRAVGWFAAGMIFMTNPNMMRPYSFLLAPQAALQIMFKGLFIFTCVFIVLVVKTALTVGTHDTMSKFMNLKMADVMTRMSKTDFLRGVMARGMLGGIFQFIGWTLFAVVVNKDVFTWDFGG